jgi:pantoate--beta-alanine ligase
MKTVSTIKELHEHLKGRSGVAFVPTMGNLHAGHIHLVELAKQHGQCIVVSIFVNPLQFGPTEDLASYPRTLEADLEKLEKVGVDIVFTPTVSEMYPVPQTISIALPAIADELCGASRPGHFAGVAIVVLKLFNAVIFKTAGPNMAVFGKKDFQQLFIIRQMVKQLNLPIEIIASETVRESVPEVAGLAMSSRNGYLSQQDRIKAKALYQTLQTAALAIQNGADINATEADALDSLRQLGWQADYISVRSATTLVPASSKDRDLVILGAARLTSTRLIDNIEFSRSA